MRRHTWVLSLAIAVLTLCALPLEASANGAGGGSAGACMVSNPGGGATAIRGVAAVVIPDAYLPGPVLNPAATVEVTLRLQKGSVVQAFRLQIPGITISNFLDNTAMACLFLDPAVTNSLAVRHFVDAIAQFFGVGPVTRFVITSKSITGTDAVPSHAQQICADVALDGASGLPVCTAGTNGVSSVADIVFYTQ